jgi:hypothetical protein
MVAAMKSTYRDDDDFTQEAAHWQAHHADADAVSGNGEYDNDIARQVAMEYDPALPPLADAPPDIPPIDGLPVTAYRASDLDVLADTPVDFIIRGFLVDGTAGMWGGAQKTLKTELQIGLDLSVATGVPFLRHTEFTVERTGPVLVFIGEGGLAPYMRRVRRVAHAYGLEANPDNYVITGHLGDMSDPEFIEQVAATVEGVDPVLVRIDPYYAYHGGDTEAGNLFAQGKLLTRFQTAVAGRTFLLTHHFNEGGRGLDLARFTQAGSAQWIDSWVQVVHRETPNPDEGLFWLGLKVGSRQWGERLYEVDVNLGAFNMGAGRHNGEPTWDVRQIDYSAIEEWGRGVRKPAQDRRPEIAKILRDEPWALTRTQLVKMVGGHAQATRGHIDELIGSRTVLRADVTYLDSAKRTRSKSVLGFAPEVTEIYGIGIPINYPEPPEEAS